jgi:hypothetical protein
MDVMGADVRDPAPEPGDLVLGLVVAAGADAAAGPFPAQMPQLLQRRLQRPRVRHPLDHLAVTVGDSGQHSHPYINTYP